MQLASYKLRCHRRNIRALNAYPSDGYKRKVPTEERAVKPVLEAVRYCVHIMEKI
jgi:hypothetical protein